MKSLTLMLLALATALLHGCAAESSSTTDASTTTAIVTTTDATTSDSATSTDAAPTTAASSTTSGQTTTGEATTDAFSTSTAQSTMGSTTTNSGTTTASGSSAGSEMSIGSETTTESQTTTGSETTTGSRTSTGSETTIISETTSGSRANTGSETPTGSESTTGSETTIGSEAISGSASTAETTSTKTIMETLTTSASDELTATMIGFTSTTTEHSPTDPKGTASESSSSTEVTTTQGPTATSDITLSSGNAAIATSTEAAFTSGKTSSTETASESVTAESQPSTSEVAVTTSEVAVTTSEVAVTTSEVAVTTSEVAVTTSEVAVTTSEVAVTTSEVAVTASGATTSSGSTSLELSTASDTTEQTLTATGSTSEASTAEDLSTVAATTYELTTEYTSTATEITVSATTEEFTMETLATGTATTDVFSSSSTLTGSSEEMTTDESGSTIEGLSTVTGSSTQVTQTTEEDMSSTTAVVPLAGCISHLCFDYNGVHSNARCDPEADEGHVCYEVLDNVTSECEFRCQCASGYSVSDDGTDCQDINECDEDTNRCKIRGELRQSVWECFNYRGGYSCICADGYSIGTGHNSGMCIDIDECSEPDLNDCDVEERANCINTIGSWNCSCKDNYDGDGHTCKLNRFQDKNFADNATEAYLEGSTDEYTELFYFPDGGIVMSNSYMGLGVVNSIYATRSGLVVFTNYQPGDPADQYAFPQPDEQSLAQWSEVVQDVDPNIVAIGAIYWADCVIAPGGGLYKKYVTREDNAAFFTASLSEAEWAIIFTWHRMTPNQDPIDENQINSFQAVLFGDASRRTMHGLLLYQDQEMTWDLTIWGSVQDFYPARIGFFTNSLYGPPVTDEYVYSGLSQQNYDDEIQWDAAVEKISRPDMIYIGSPDVNTALSLVGKFLYNITDNGPDYIHSGLACKSWITEEKSSEWWPSEIIAGLCAGTLGQMRSVLRSSWVPIYNRYSLDYTCYELRRPINYKGHLASPRCCYDRSDDSLLPSFINDAIDVGGLSLVKRDSDNSAADAAYERCCNPFYSFTGETPDYMCDDYIELRPPSSSDWFVILAVTQSRGDPHITTLDGLSYTFNGLGEFKVIVTPGFELQGRAEPVTVNNVAQGATIFTAFAGQQTNGSKAELRLNSTLNGIELIIDDVTRTVNWSGVTNYNRVSVLLDAQEYTLSFENGITIKLAVDYGMLTVSALMPSAFAGNVSGLMGNFNGNQSDEFAYPNGTQFQPSINVTEETIYPWGLTWRIQQRSSLFRYDRHNYTFYNNASYTPVFFNPNLTIMFNNNATAVQAALDACNGGAMDSNPTANSECYFDFKVTGNPALAAATAATAKALEAEKTALANFAPTISNGNASVQVMVGRSYPSLVTIRATDKNDGDIISYILINNSISGINVSSQGVLSWSNVPYAANGSLSVRVTDGKASATFNPQVAICNCQNGGTCMFNKTSTAQWYTVPCLCAMGYTGSFCEKDIDGCAQKPCFTACTDIPANKVALLHAEFTCDPCPVGLVGDGRTCYDRNECLLDRPCQYANLCVNTIGSFKCSCPAGYALKPDGKTCQDIDECKLGTSNCDANLATCTNTIGGFNCSCNEGYRGSGVAGSCLNVDECSTTIHPCGNFSKCVDTTGSYRCDCNLGYELSNGHCVEIDECLYGNQCSQNCVDGIGAYSCTCDQNFVLNTVDKRSCQPAIACTAAEAIASCDNGNNRSTCGKDPSGSILCYCPPGLTLNSAKVCVDIDECATGRALCSAATSVCNNTLSGYVCVCKPGYTRASDGITCTDINECSTNGKSNCSQLCSNTDGSFTCDCRSGYILHTDGKTCVDINECASPINNECDARLGTCANQIKNSTYPLGYTCSCPTGYGLSADGFTCADVNECNLASRGGCKQGCINSLGSYMCVCNSGYLTNTSNPLDCININECSNTATHSCFSGSYCTDTIGSYVCSCPTGFKLKSDGFTCESLIPCGPNNCSYTCNVVNSTDTCQCPRGKTLASDNITCIDIDECATDANTCEDANNVKCYNTDPGYQCICKDASLYQRVEAAKCIDIDECAANTYSCGSNSYCVNQAPGYKCACESGYALNSAGRCVDINECIGNNTCNHQTGICTNIPGAYSCSCMPGYQGDGQTCSDIDECAAGLDDCDPDVNRRVCTNTVGSFVCSCRAGYLMTQKATGQICDDINECKTPQAYNISCDQVCENTAGGFTCACTNLFRLNTDGTTCIAKAPCNNSNACEQDCAKINGTDTCVCRPGYTLSGTSDCVDVDECLNNPCDASHGVCNNTEGSYVCGCKDGYKLGANDVCKDRDGGLGVWQEWGSCTTQCGDLGNRTRIRPCDSPTQQSDGLPCSGNATQTQSCNRILCQDQLDSGVSIKMLGLTSDDFHIASVLDSFEQTVASSLNSYCSFNLSMALSCCQSTANLSNFADKLFTSVDTISTSAFDTANKDGVNVIVVIGYDSSDEFCGPSASRKRRAASLSIDQSMLLSALTNPTLLSQISSAISEAIFSATGKKVTITVAAPSIPTQVTAAPMVPLAITTTTPMTTTRPAGGVQAWVIAVAVIGCLIFITLAIILIVILIKRPRKVGSGDISDGHNEQAAPRNA